MKILFKNYFIPIILIILSLLFYIIFSAFSYSNAVFNNISDSVFRLHVIANSNSEEDQNLKYEIRDALIDYMNKITINSNSKDMAITLANDNKNEFYKIAKNIVDKYDLNYDVKIEIGNFYFPTKHYGDISLPAGNYDALKVEIGEAKGENWWCVMFPPLCFVDVSSGIVPEESKNIMQDNLSSEEYTVISNSDDTNYKLKFKIIELFQKL